MKFKFIIILVILFIANSMFSQQGISLLNPKGGDLEFIREHHRIKIKTDNGKTIALVTPISTLTLLFLFLSILF